MVPDAQPEHAVRLLPWMNLQAPESDKFHFFPGTSQGRVLSGSWVLLSRLMWLRSFPMDRRYEWSGNERISAWSVPGGRSGSRRAGGAHRTLNATITVPNGKTARTYGSIATSATAAGSSMASSTDLPCPNNPLPNSMCRSWRGTPRPVTAPPQVRYVELHCKTNFSFLEGASHPNELVAQAASLGYAGMAVTDRNSLAGVVRAHVAAKEIGLKLLIGAEITLVDAQPVLLWAMNRAGLWPALSAADSGPSSGSQGRVPPRLRGRRRARKRPACRCACCRFRAQTHRSCSSGAMSFLIEPTLWPSCIAARSIKDGCASGSGRPTQQVCRLVAAGDVHYHDARRRYLQDVLTAIRLKKTVAELGLNRFPNSERRLRPLDEIVAIHAGCRGRCLPYGRGG